MQDKITKADVLADPNNSDNLYMYMAQNNDPIFNYNKALEECVEFMEVIIKLQTKSKTNPKRPKASEAVGEFGDMVLRGVVALMTLFPEDEEIAEKIEDHISKKTQKLLGWLEKGTYVNGL